MAQEATHGRNRWESVAETETLVKEETVAEQPRVLISEVLIEGIEGHPEEERLRFHLRRHAGASGDARHPEEL